MTGPSAARFIVTGRVQGVGFRWFAAHHARRLGLTGVARNLSDGRVEVIAVGTAAAIVELEELLATGPDTASVRGLERSDLSAPLPEYHDFRTG